MSALHTLGVVTVIASATCSRQGSSRSSAAPSAAGPSGERRGYVERVAGAEDARVRNVSLTELAGKLGQRRAEAARRVLAEIAAELGADAAVRGRRVRPPR